MNIRLAASTVHARIAALLRNGRGAATYDADDIAGLGDSGHFRWPHASSASPTRYARRTT